MTTALLILLGVRIAWTVIGVTWTMIDARNVANTDGHLGYLFMFLIPELIVWHTLSSLVPKPWRKKK